MSYCTCRSNPCHCGTPLPNPVLPAIPYPAGFIQPFECSETSGTETEEAAAVASQSLPVLSTGFTAPVIGQNASAQVAGASLQLYPNQILFFPGLGCVTVLSVTGDSFTFRNDSITAGEVLPIGLAFQGSIPGDCFTVNLTLAQLSDVLCNQTCPDAEAVLKGILMCSDKGIVSTAVAGPAVMTVCADGTLLMLAPTADGDTIEYNTASGCWRIAPKKTQSGAFSFVGVQSAIDTVSNPNTGKTASGLTNILEISSTVDPDGLSASTADEVRVKTDGYWKIQYNVDIHNNGLSGVKTVTEMQINGARVLTECGFVGTARADDAASFVWFGELKTGDVVRFTGSTSGGAARWHHGHGVAELKSLL